ncbi:uncharacterized protein LOC125656947 [Ostrea edulis]|uniref:uncharacterized protein LOC125656947 n=1 Tax=Ostrea edulis TaxID=37623 RepID=UPI0024AF3993|nr:uncharacterized protein LOC125656947 [Ostrea edulis]
MTELRIFCLWIFNITWISGQYLTGENICGNKTFMTCCKDYVQVANTCVECEPGYWGYNCSSPCPPNHYGRKCSQICDCSPSEYCDRGWGCLCNETSLNCTNTETETTAKNPYGADHTVNHTDKSGNSAANKRYLLNVVLPCLMSAILILLIGISSLRLWNKFKRRRVEKETQELDDIPELHIDGPTSPSALQTPQTGERQPEDTYAHTTFGIYNHVSLRVQYSKESVYDTGKRPDIDESPPCPGLPPDTIFEQDEEPVHDRQKDSQSESDDSENEYFDVSYTGQVLCSVQESPGQTSSLTSNSNMDNEDVSDYVNWKSMQEGHFYGSEVYSCNEDVMLHQQHLK